MVALSGAVQPSPLVHPEHLPTPAADSGLNYVRGEAFCNVASYQAFGSGAAIVCMADDSLGYVVGYIDCHG